MTTGCGPLNFSDTLERICYQGVLVAAGMALFRRIVTQDDLAATCSEYFGELLEWTIVQVRLSEFLLLLAVVGAFVALAVQYASGAQMDGMSGIDIQLCIEPSEIFDLIHPSLNCRPRLPTTNACMHACMHESLLESER
jgi:hypothetical protein